MAGSAIVARLQLDSKDYDKKLAEAKKKTSDFAKGGGAGLTDMVGKFKTLAGAVAACKAAQEVFNATIQSSQTIGDAYTVVVSQCKGAVDEFVYAMANADFSGFNDGLKGIFKNAKEAAQAMDALGNAQISFDYLTAGYKSDFKTNMGTAKDKSKSLTERQAAYDAALGDLDKIGEAVQTYTDKAIKAVVESAQAKGNNINESFITRENIDRVFKLDLSANGDAEKAALADRYKEFKKISKEMREQERLAAAYSQQLTLGNVPQKDRAKTLEKQRAAEAKAAELRAKINSDDMQMAALYNAMLVKGTDEWLKGLADLVTKADNANSQYQELKTSSLEVKNQLASAGKEADKLAASAAKAAQAAAAAANEARAREAGILGNIAANNPANAKVAGIGGGSSVSAIPDKIEMPAAVTEDATKRAEEYNNALKVLEETSVSASEGLGAIGNIMGTIGGAMGEGAGAWMNYAGSIISAVGSALPSLEALAAAQAAAAATKTALSPWTVIASVAAVGSIVAAMANLPKFATGGVVPGNMMSGDNVLIRANSGEVVLTKSQANNIGDRLNGGMNGKVVFKIEGSTLVGVLNNNQKIASRNYGA